MKKLLKFSKTPLAIISSVIFVAFMVVLMVACLVPHGTTYSATRHLEQEVFGQTMTIDSYMEITFKDDKTAEMKSEMTMNGEKNEDIEPVTIQYKIENGELYISMNAETEPTIKVGNINSFDINYDLANLGVEVPEGEESAMVLKCNTTYLLRDLSIAFMCVGGVLLAGSLTIIILDKKGIIK
ncbi:MAG: hypothetical protein K2K31_01040 [Clostridia bacterium]|nr:hypothetical protein [Clostridia bacterium]